MKKGTSVLGINEVFKYMNSEVCMLCFPDFNLY